MQWLSKHSRFIFHYTSPLLMDEPSRAVVQHPPAKTSEDLVDFKSIDDLRTNSINILSYGTKTLILLIGLPTW